MVAVIGGGVGGTDYGTLGPDQSPFSAFEIEMSNPFRPYGTLMISTYTGGIADTNAYVLALPEGTLLVDAPEGVTDWLLAKGLKPDALFLTHQHFDHVMDASRVKQAFGCKVLSWSTHSRDLTLETLFALYSGGGLSVPPFEVDQVLAGQDKVSLLGIDWDLYHIPGHSPDSLCLHDSSSGLLFGGDVLFAGSIGRTDFPGGSSVQLVTGIEEKLLVLPDATEVFPGHGPPTTIGQEREGNPYL